MVLRVGLHCEICGTRELLDFNSLPNASESKGFVARPHGAEGWFSL